MSVAVRALEPKDVWKNFADLNAVPRPSKKEERVIQFMMDFGASLDLETFTDAVGNVIVRKPATAGMEDRKCVTLQSHLDMVHQKNNDTVFDFDTQGIDMFVDADWVKAKGTTLGADNGMGVAAIMALLESTTIAHPQLEALFTIDEETGMTGAMGLEGGVLKGEILLNLDTEEDDEIDIGCMLNRQDRDAIRVGVFEGVVQAFLQDAVDSHLLIKAPVLVQYGDFGRDLTRGAFGCFFRHDFDRCGQAESLQNWRTQVSGDTANVLDGLGRKIGDG